MSTRPVIFISAVSKELCSARDLVAKTLIALGYEPKWQDIAATETGMLPEVLRNWIDDSVAVLQLVGHCYGFAPKEPDAVFGECSYTQLEALYARQKGKKVYYILLDNDHPTDPCAAEDSALRELQYTYRVKVTGTTHLYHPSSSLHQTELIVRRMKDELAELRKRGQRHAAIVVGLLVVLVLGIGWLKHDLSRQKEATTETQAVVAKIKDQNDKFLQALRDLPQTLSQQSRGDAHEDETARIARAYTVLETQLQLPRGSLVKELPYFAQQLLLRADTSAMDRATALFVTKNFAEAEAEALKAKDHALAAAGQPVQDAIAALRLAGQSALAQIRYPQAMEHYRDAAVLISPERDVLQWLDLQNSINWLYHLQGRYSEGLAQARQIWKIAQQASKEEAPAMLNAHMHYARALYDNGQAAAAEQEYRTVIVVLKRVLGAEHPDTLASRNNLATALTAQGQFAKAEQEYRAVLQLQERVLGTEHPDTLASRNNLASALDAQGKHAEAEQENRAVLQIKERVLGAEHPDTLMSRMNLALALNAQGKHAEAEQEYHAVLKLQERVMGAEHPEVARSCYNLALCLEAQHKLPEALQFMQRAEQVWTNSPGPDHADTKDAKAAREHLEAALK